MAEEKEVAEVTVDETVRTPQQGPGIIPETVWDEFLKGQGVEEKAIVEEPEEELGGEKPAETPPKEQPKTEEKTPEEPDAVEAALAEIDATLGEINTKLDARPAEKPEIKPEPANPVIDPAIQSLLDHEDPAVSAGAKALLERQGKLEARLDGVEKHLTSREIADEAVKVEAEMTQAAELFGLTEEQVDQVAEYLESDPVLASTLTFREGIQRIFPDATPRTKATPKEGPAGKSGPTVRVASQPREAGGLPIDKAAAAGAVPTTERAPEGENMEQAVDRGFRKLFSGT